MTCAAVSSRAWIAPSWRTRLVRSAGASAMLARLRADGHAVAFATGCWEASAHLKLSRSLIEVADCAVVACDDEPDRVAILRSAMKRVALDGGRVVYVGDGPWDVQAAKSLQLPFVGIDHDKRGRLRGLGVGSVLLDFRDYGAFLGALVRALPPATDDG